MSKDLDLTTCQTVDSTFLHKKGLCGLCNLGNTCFMNSIIQCLNNTLPLLEYFVQNEYLKDINKQSSDFNITNEWNLVCRGLWHKNALVNPKKFHSAIRLRAIERDYDDFTGFGQNDSQEFLQFLLESLHNSLSKKVNMNIVGKPVNDLDKIAIEALTAWTKYFQSDYSKIVEIFYGQYFSRLITKKNKKIERSNTFDPFSCICLEATPKCHNIYDCLDSFTSKEDLSTDEEDIVRHKSISFWKLPKILIIFLKRYNNLNKKVNTKIDFPLTDLDMSKYVLGYNKSKYIYDLYAVSNHAGSPMGGHYYAFCKNYDGNWYKYDDNVVFTLNVLKVVDSSAYCLFYRLKE